MANPSVVQVKCQYWHGCEPIAPRASWRPDILINNAGTGRWAYLEECSYDKIDEIIGAPLHAALYITRTFLPAMLHRGSGAIGNVTFIGAFLPWPGATGCTAVRWGMRGFHEALKADLRGTNLSATLVAASSRQNTGERTVRQSP